MARNRRAVKPTAEFVGYIGSLHRAIHSIGLLFERALDGEVSQAEALVLLHLLSNPDSTINDVHRAFLHRRSTLTSVLDRLESKRILKRAASERDRRNLILTLTPYGRETAARVAAALASLEESLDTPRTDFAAACRLLEKTAFEGAELLEE